ncbi:MAG: DUF3817 domain-containing protein [Mycobacteriales bacterium]
MTGALLRFRIIAVVVGVGLVVLCCIGLPLKYIGNSSGVVAVVGPIHGFLYILYVLATLHLAIRARWTLGKVVLVALAGTIPFMSFVAERKVHAELSDTATTPAPSAT